MTERVKYTVRWMSRLENVHIHCGNTTLGAKVCHVLTGEMTMTATAKINSPKGRPTEKKLTVCHVY